MKSDMVKSEAFAEMTRALTVGRDYSQQLATTEEFFRPIVMAEALNALRAAIGPGAIAVLRSMENTPLGFRTDRTDGYADHVLRDVMIQAMIDGLSFAGNQFNVIAGSYYVTKQGWAQKLTKLGASGITPYCSLPAPEDVIEGPPNDRGQRKFTCKVGGYAECLHQGQRVIVHMRDADGYDTRRIASAFGRDIADACPGITGKAEAALLKKLYYTCAGEPEPDEPGTPVTAEYKLIEPEVTTPASDDQHSMHDKAMIDIAGATSLEQLSAVWEAVNQCRKTGDLTPEQIKELGKLKDKRKAELK